MLNCVQKQKLGNSNCVSFFFPMVILAFRGHISGLIIAARPQWSDGVRSLLKKAISRAK